MEAFDLGSGLFLLRSFLTRCLTSYFYFRTLMDWFSHTVTTELTTIDSIANMYNVPTVM